jgi:hypothetical protein
MNVNKSNKKLIGVPYASNKILKNNENYHHQIININTMYVDDNENINNENINNENINNVNINNENEYLLKEKNKYIKYSSFEFEKKRNDTNYCLKGIMKEFLFYIGCLDKIN